VTDHPDSDQPTPDAPEPDPVTPLTTPADGVPPVLVTSSEFESAATALAAGTGPIALDTERASGFRYSQRAYLVQLRRRGAGSFLIDPIDEPDGLAGVASVLSDAEWVLHAADQDLPSLRELGFQCTQLYDTELGCRLLGLPRVNLAEMVAHFLGLGLAKGHGAADWSQRPLPDEWLNYAALDVEVLIELRDAVDAALAEAGKDEWARQEFEWVRTRPEPPEKPDRWRRVSGIHGVKGARALAVVRELWSARDELARKRDVAPGRVLPDAAIVAAATKPPKSVAELTAMPIYKGPRQRRQAGRWFTAIDHAQRLPESELPRRNPKSTGLPPTNRWEDRNPEAAKRYQTIRPALLALAEAKSLPLENLLAPDIIRQLCWDGFDANTESAVAQRLAATGARPWQQELVIPVIVGALK
jgi:ribonuclease D